MRWQLLDSIDELIPGERALGTRRWDGALPLFQDHFPTFAVVTRVRFRSFPAMEATTTRTTASVRASWSSSRPA